ncbi:MAG: hypothetical protein JWR72_2186 [Flavisolibacter sp.]|jgi:hypothetical protein|nr:hypothetical protein [Flavisolibacter sp.]
MIINCVINSHLHKKNVNKKSMIFFLLVKNLFNIVVGNLFSLTY